MMSWFKHRALEGQNLLPSNTSITSILSVLFIVSINEEMRKFSDSPEAPSSRKRGPYLELKRL